MCWGSVALLLSALTRTALLSYQVKHLHCCWTLLNKLFTKWAVLKQLRHHQTRSDRDTHNKYPIWVHSTTVQWHILPHSCFGCAMSQYKMHWGSDLVLISARRRTTAITGLAPSPDAGRDVWMDRLLSCGSNMDCTAWTTFSVMDSLCSGRALQQTQSFKIKTWHQIPELL